jgi:prevent-host-death family protein
MGSVTIRQLRNHAGDVLRRVEAGERLTVTRDGEPVAELVPLRRRPLSRETLLEHYRHLPRLDPEALRRDIDELIDSKL